MIQNISTVVIGNTEYWKVNGLTGTGGGNIIAAVNTPAAAASSSVTSVLLAATGLDIMQAIGVSLFAMGITVFIYVTRRTSRL